LAANTGCRVSLIAVPVVDSAWPFITYGLEHACLKTGGEITSDYLWRLCRSGEAYLFAVADGEQVIGAAVLRFEAWTSGRKLRLMALYGERMTDWGEQMLNQIEQIAKVGGATSIVAEGRLGWARRYPKARVLRKTYEMDLRT
jgi:hypothetical protein